MFHFEERITKAPAAEKFTSIIQNTLAQTKGNLEKAQDQMKAQADKCRSIAPKYQIGVTVLGSYWDHHVFTSFSSIRRHHSSRCASPFDGQQANMSVLLYMLKRPTTH
jgi:hypothetical protein